MPGSGVVVERTYIPSQPYEIAKNGEKTGCFAHFLAYNSPKRPFFAQKYVTRNTHETFFEEYTNFQAHYFSHCGVIPLQSIGSHIRPQPHGLGLTNFHVHGMTIENWIKYFDSFFYILTVVIKVEGCSGKMSDITSEVAGAYPVEGDN